MNIQGDPQEFLKKFLSAEVYIEAPNQTLGDYDWEMRKVAIFLKSAFIEFVNGKTHMDPKMEEVCTIHSIQRNYCIYRITSSV